MLHVVPLVLPHSSTLISPRNISVSDLRQLRSLFTATCITWSSSDRFRGSYRLLSSTSWFSSPRLSFHKIPSSRDCIIQSIIPHHCLHKSPSVLAISSFQRNTFLVAMSRCNPRSAHFDSYSRPTASSRIASLVVTAFVITTTASVSYAAYYWTTSLLIFSSIVPAAKGDNVVEKRGDKNEKSGILYKEEYKKDHTYGYDYVGFDTYIGMEQDDGTGVSTAEVKAASVKAISRAFDAAGLNDSGIVKNGRGEYITLHPRHVHRTICPVYGCPLLPLDVHYEKEAKATLEELRNSQDSSAKTAEKVERNINNNILESSGSSKAATLTLIGYKGGKMEDQINQDRALVLSPFKYWNIHNSSNTANTSKRSIPTARLIGTFDGHARYGERVSEYVVKTLPALLGSKLINFYATNDEVDTTSDEQEENHKIAAILHETFLELDATAPADPSGGCTATVILQLGSKIYIANAGDSRSFVGVHIIPPDGTAAATSIMYRTREDKPHLSVERERVEHMGGTVFLPKGFLTTAIGTTRVLYKDPTTGSTSGLAMSRSTGDWDAGNVGVIPDPLVDVMDINVMKKKILDYLNGPDGAVCVDNENENVIRPGGEDTTAKDSQCIRYTEKDIKVFGISATDGLLDYLSEDTIAKYVTEGLYHGGISNNEKNSVDETDTRNLLIACEHLIYAAAHGWQQDKGGRYRDDIAIAVADLE